MSKPNDTTGSEPSPPSPLSPATTESSLSLPRAVESPPNGSHATTTAVHEEATGNGKQRAMHPSDELRRVESERERVDEGGLTGCREAVEILTRNPKKGSFRVLCR